MYVNRYTYMYMFIYNLIWINFQQLKKNISWIHKIYLLKQKLPQQIIVNSSISHSFMFKIFKLERENKLFGRFYHPNFLFHPWGKQRIVLNLIQWKHSSNYQFTKHQIVLFSETFTSLHCGPFHQLCMLQNQDRVSKFFQYWSWACHGHSFYSFNRSYSAQLCTYFYVLRILS